MLPSFSKISKISMKNKFRSLYIYETSKSLYNNL